MDKEHQELRVTALNRKVSDLNIYTYPCWWSGIVGPRQTSARERIHRAVTLATVIRVYERNGGWQYGYHNPSSRLPGGDLLHALVAIEELIQMCVKI